MATKKSGQFSDFEREAMKNRALELKAEANRESGEKMLLDAIAKLPEPDRSMAKKVHSIVMNADPKLMPKTWYGMPAYAKNDKVICFFQSAAKFKARYATFGFNDAAMLDDGDMWATGFAVRKLTPAGEKKIADLVKKAAGK